MEPNYPYIHKLVNAHATLLPAAFAILMPMAILLLRFKSVRAHYIVQIIAVVFSLAGFGIAIAFSSMLGFYDSYHQIIGITAIMASLLNALGGAVQHMNFKRQNKSAAVSTGSLDSSSSDTEKKGGVDHAEAAAVVPKKKTSPLAHLHMWFGRAIMILGTINIAFGFQLSASYGYSTISKAIGVGVAAGVVVLASLLVAGFMGFKSKRS